MFHENTAIIAGAARCQNHQPTQWGHYDDLLFEQALLEVSEDLPDRWERIAEQVPGKSAVEVILRYEDLVRDVAMIESGLVEVPSYPDELKMETLGAEYEAAQERLNEEMRVLRSEKWRSGSGFNCWWETLIDNMDLGFLKQFSNCLIGLCDSLMT